MFWACILWEKRARGAGKREFGRVVGACGVEGEGEWSGVEEKEKRKRVEKKQMYILFATDLCVTLPQSIIALYEVDVKNSPHDLPLVDGDKGFRCACCPTR